MPSENKTCYRFPGTHDAILSDVGGKGFSLIKAGNEGLPVPPGFILSTYFFEPFFEVIFKAQEWTDLLNSSEAKYDKEADELKKRALRLRFSSEQKRVIIAELGNFGKDEVFAVRSSSPEEDLEGTSFAGIYETILGVTIDKLEDAVVKAFSSCLDYRVFVYKKQHGFDIAKPKIAVVIQQQIASEISGVGFSLNPVNNSFDEAVINSNWGLGETVVSGAGTPDTFIVDKISLQCKSVVIGAKEKQVWLEPGGGTGSGSNYRQGEKTLNQNDLEEVTGLIKRVEEIYRKPADIEWAYAEGKLYLLQARPITAFIPVSEAMITKPGEEKFLYMDATISVQGIYKPISNMATSVYNLIVSYIGKTLFYRSIELIPKKTIAWFSEGRVYLNLSKVFALIGKDKYESFISSMDSLASQTIKSVDEKEYKRKFNKLFFKLMVISIILRAMPYILRAFFFPEYTNRVNQKKIEAFEVYARELLKKDISLEELAEKLIPKMIKVNFKYSSPIAFFARKILSRIQTSCGKENSTYAGKLSLALPNNVTTQMGLELFKLAELIPVGFSESELAEITKERFSSSPFVKEWNRFLDKYGHRCPGEFDMAAPRYRDNPEGLIKLLASIRSSARDESPLEKFAKQQIERRDAYEYLHEKIKTQKGKFSAWIFKKKYSFAQTFAGYRETHKYLLILVVDVIRMRLLAEARKLCLSKRLKTPDQIFDLKFNELVYGLKDDSVNLSETAAKSSAFIKKLAECPELPTIFDSRGLILRPPKKTGGAGEIIGTAISSGKVTGRIKVLNSPTEKRFLKGEILVARATDPGWTPLFINAAGVVLEVGGILQHGALVAREYGLPCVAGIENATQIFKDGMLAEVDGSNGVIKILEDLA